MEGRHSFERAPLGIGWPGAVRPVESRPPTAGPARGLLKPVVDLELAEGARRSALPSVTGAVILAGSPGSALCPLACVAPRHALPVANEPVLGHLLRTLAGWGIVDVTLMTAGGMGASEAAGASAPGAHVGLPLRVVRQERYDGTGGALRDARHYLGGDHFLVVDSSLVGAELSIAEALAFHVQSGAGLTVIVHRSVTGGFAEEIALSAAGELETWNVPYRSTPAESGLRSAGIYLIRPDVLELIPARGHCDLKEQLVPLLRREGVAIRACRAARVRRITTFDDYLEANREMVARGFVPPGGYRELAPGVWAGRGAQASPKAELRGPLLLGIGCRIEPGARVIGPAAIGDGCLVGRDAVVRDSVLWRDVEVGAGATIERSVVTESAAVPPARHVCRAAIIDAARCQASRKLLRHCAARSVPVLVSHRSRGRLAALADGGRRSLAAAAARRAVEIAASAAGLVVLGPLMAAAAIAIKLDSPGPVFFRQRRCSRDGRLFSMVKLRTMVADAERRQEEFTAHKDVDGPVFKLYRDPRVTRVGAWLRRTNLDELPQLYNVLRGEMSLVGPRPLAMEEMRCAPGWRDIRLSVKPGVTGLWQVHGCYRSSFADWIRLDIEYIRRQSLTLDARILLRTAAIVFGRWGRGESKPERPAWGPAGPDGTPNGNDRLPG